MTFKVVVDDPAHPFVEPDTSVNDTGVTDTSVAIGLRGLAGELDASKLNANEPVQVFDMQGRFLGTSLKRIRLPGVYIVRQGVQIHRVRIQ